MKKASCSSMKVLMLGVVVCLLIPFRAVRADFTFGKPTKVPNVNSNFSDSGPQISRDGLELYYNYSFVQGKCSHDIWVSRRSTINDPWSEPVKLDAPVNSPGPQTTPSISADRLELYFSEGYGDVISCAPNPEGYGHTDLWVSTRVNIDDPWGAPKNLGPTVNSSNVEDCPCISANGLSLYFVSDRGGMGNSDVYVTTRPSKQDPWGEPVNLGSNVNSDYYEYTVFISPDDLSLFVSRGWSQPKIFVCRRKSSTDPWGPAELFMPVNSGDYLGGNVQGNGEFCLSFSEADLRLYFSRGTSVHSFNFDIWQVEVIPIVDFNGDGKVGINDLTRLINCWGQDEPLCDIGSFPFPDGKIDEADLEVLMEHWQQEVDDPTLLANWRLDETEGGLAFDSAAENDAAVMGAAVWKPDEGMVDGTLYFDGIDDYIKAPVVLNPLDVPFSVFAWIKGGAPGQVILSQKNSVNWLMVDTELASLRSDLSDPM